MGQIKRVYLIIFFLTFYHTSSALTIGTLAYNPPFEVVTTTANGEEFFGFEVQLMKEICQRINEPCSFKNIPFHQLPRQINAGKIDLGIGAIIITPERRQQFLFSLPYKESHLQYITLAKADFDSIEALRGKILGLYADSPSRPLALKQFNNAIQLKFFHDSMDMLYALNKQQVNAIITNSSQALYWMANNTNVYKLLGKAFPVGEGYGIMAKLGRNDLITKINNALLSMEQDGTYLKIFESSF